MVPAACATACLPWRLLRVLDPTWMPYARSLGATFLQGAHMLIHYAQILRVGTPATLPLPRLPMIVWYISWLSLGGVLDSLVADSTSCDYTIILRTPWSLSPCTSIYTVTDGFRFTCSMLSHCFSCPSLLLRTALYHTSCYLRVGYRREFPSHGWVLPLVSHLAVGSLHRWVLLPLPTWIFVLDYLVACLQVHQVSRPFLRRLPGIRSTSCLPRARSTLSCG